jgi:fumarylacetoacetate (FAA) hydrolase
VKVGSLKHPKKKDGDPVVISRDGQFFVRVGHIVSTLREAIEDWEVYRPKLEIIYGELNAGRIKDAQTMDESLFHSPLPRSFQWADGSAFIQHVKLVRKARNAPLPETLNTVPLMYQGGSDLFLAPQEDIPLRSEKYGLDFEGEFAVITDIVPMGVTAEEALSHIVLLLSVNDVSLRGLVPDELAQGFGFFQSKPSSAFGPFAVTPDELAEGWKHGRVHLQLRSEYNGKWFGEPNGSEMHFHFGQLIAHAARTRALAAGSIIGSGTVSNEDETKGSSCLAEKRMLEQIKDGKIKTPFMKVGDTIKIWCESSSGANIFGTINQKVVSAERPDTF